MTFPLSQFLRGRLQHTTVQQLQAPRLRPAGPFNNPGKAPSALPHEHGRAWLAAVATVYALALASGTAVLMAVLGS